MDMLSKYVAVSESELDEIYVWLNFKVVFPREFVTKNNVIVPLFVVSFKDKIFFFGFTATIRFTDFTFLCLSGFACSCFLTSFLKCNFSLFTFLYCLTHCGRGHLNCLNARSRGLNNLNQLLYCVFLNIYNKFANYFCELKVSGNTHQIP